MIGSEISDEGRGQGRLGGLWGQDPPLESIQGLVLSCPHSPLCPRPTCPSLG